MTPTSARLSSLDQFRGATVLAMLAVNFVGGLANVPAGLLHHHTYCSFADTIMPAFLFAVGFGFRLSFLRRRDADGAWPAYRHAVGRCGGLLLLGVLLYHLTGKYETFDDLTAKPLGEMLLAAIKRGPFETLTHIAVTSLWVLPVVAAPGWVRVLFAVGSGALHVWASHRGYYEWNLANPRGIDGGPLGFLTWTIPLILGTLAHDWLRRDRPRGVAELLLLGVLAMAAGYFLSLQNKFREPNDIHRFINWNDIHDGAPFTGPPQVFAVNYWTMSQRAGSVTYPLFAGGLALSVFAGCVWLCDRRGVRWSYLDLLGRHALAAYVVHGMAEGAVRPFVPKDSPLWWVGVGFGVYLLLTTVVLRYLDRNRLLLKL